MKKKGKKGKGVYTAGTAKQGLWKRNPAIIKLEVGRLSKTYTPSSLKAANDTYASLVRRFRDFTCGVTVLFVRDGIISRSFVKPPNGRN